MSASRDESVEGRFGWDQIAPCLLGELPLSERNLALVRQWRGAGASFADLDPVTLQLIEVLRRGV